MILEGAGLCVCYSVMCPSFNMGNHPHSPSVCMFVCPGVEGGAVRVTGAKGYAPPHDYKVNTASLSIYVYYIIASVCCKLSCSLRCVPPT